MNKILIKYCEDCDYFAENYCNLHQAEQQPDELCGHHSHIKELHEKNEKQVKKIMSEL